MSAVRDRLQRQEETGRSGDASSAAPGSCLRRDRAHGLLSSCAGETGAAGGNRGLLGVSWSAGRVLECFRA